MCKRSLCVSVLVLAASSIGLGFGGLNASGSGYAFEGYLIGGYQEAASQRLEASGFQWAGVMPGYGSAFALQAGIIGLDQLSYTSNSQVPYLTNVGVQAVYATGFQLSTAIGYPCQPYANNQSISITTQQGPPSATPE